MILWETREEISGESAESILATRTTFWQSGDLLRRELLRWSRHNLARIHFLPANQAMPLRIVRHVLFGPQVTSLVAWFAHWISINPSWVPSPQKARLGHVVVKCMGAVETTVKASMPLPVLTVFRTPSTRYATVKLKLTPSQHSAHWLMENVGDVPV